MGLFRRRNYDGFHEGFSLSRLLSKPFGFLRRRRRNEEYIGKEKSWFSRLMSVLAIPFLLLYQFLFFVVVSWSSSRHGWGFIVGIPVIAALILVSAVAILGNYYEKRFIFRMHHIQATEALINEEFEKAEVCWNRVINIREEDEFKFGYAAALFESGEEERAVRYMNYLAPEHRAGYPTAHYWLGSQYLTNRDWDYTREERLEKAKTHYGFYNDLAVRNETSQEYLDMIALKTLADIYKEEGDLEKAIPIYLRVVNALPNAAPDVAKYLNEQGRFGEAQRLIDRTVAGLWERANVNPESGIIWATMYDVLLVNSEFERLSGELQKALSSVQEDRTRLIIRRLQSNVHLEFAKEAGDEITLDNYRRKILSISRALNRYPANVEAVDAAIKLMIYPENEEYAQWADREIRENTPPWMGQVCLGMQDCLQGQTAAAKKHFEIADGLTRRGDFQLIPHIINNFAWVMASDRFEEPEDALTLIEVGIDSFPDMTKFYQSRGEILMNMDRNEQALSELEYAAETIKDDIRLHELLAQCLDKLDRPEEAEAHREIAETIRAKAEQDAKLGNGDPGTNAN